MDSKTCWLLALLMAPGSGCGSLGSPGTHPASEVSVEAAKAGGPPSVDRPPALDKDPGLVGWWTLDDDSGRAAADASRSGRDGALRGRLSFEKSSVTGRAGKALGFGGSDEDFIEITGYRGVTGARARTVAVWIKTREPEGELVSWRQDGSVWSFGFTRSRFGFNLPGGDIFSDARVHDGRWHHVAAVVKEAERPDFPDPVLLYKDGALEEVGRIGRLKPAARDAGSELVVRIGLEYAGALDDVRIYDRALSSREIETLFRSVPAGSGVSSHLRELDRRARALTHRGTP